MANILMIIGFLFVVGSLGAITKILTDISQTLQRIEAQSASRKDDSR
ncbi:MAG: hypothetical protein ABUL69_04265 [Peristeroidobacter soli]